MNRSPYPAAARQRLRYRSGRRLPALEDAFPQHRYVGPFPQVSGATLPKGLRLVAVVGLTGVGKSNLARLVAQQFAPGVVGVVDSSAVLAWCLGAHGDEIDRDRAAAFVSTPSGIRRFGEAIAEAAMATGAEVVLVAGVRGEAWWRVATEIVGPSAVVSVAASSASLVKMHRGAITADELRVRQRHVTDQMVYSLRANADLRVANVWSAVLGQSPSAEAIATRLGCDPRLGEQRRNESFQVKRTAFDSVSVVVDVASRTTWRDELRNDLMLAGWLGTPAGMVVIDTSRRHSRVGRLTDVSREVLAEVLGLVQSADGLPSSFSCAVAGSSDEMVALLRGSDCVIAPRRSLGAIDRLRTWESDDCGVQLQANSLCVVGR